MARRVLRSALMGAVERKLLEKFSTGGAAQWAAPQMHS
jgi:hypothetical protein